MTPFDQRTAACRCEWGIVGHDHRAPADVTIIVDVLSFSTCVDVAIGHDVAILPYAGGHASGEVFARDNHAELAGPRGVSRYSLSPASFLNAPRGDPLCPPVAKRRGARDACGSENSGATCWLSPQCRRRGSSRKPIGENLQRLSGRGALAG
jgi:2-phosphosulfolactate phosphatase